MDTSSNLFVVEDEPSSRIFIVDDEPRMRDSLKFLIEQSGSHIVETAENGLQALKILQRNRFDLFLVDIHMPEMNGFELLKQILAQQPDATLVMMTGEASVEGAVNALKLGAYDYLRKPFDDTDLIKTIDNALSHATMHRKLKRAKIEYKYMVENSPDLIYQLDPEGLFTFVNQAVERLLGYPPKELLGKHYTTIVHEDDQACSRFLFNERRTGNRATNETEIRLCCKPIQNADGQASQHFITVELKATGMYVDDNTDRNKKQFIGTYGVARDVSYRKQLESHLYHSQKMEAIGTLAGGIAHDFNNLLMGIQGYASLMLAGMDLKDKNYSRLMNVEQHIQCGAELTRQLLGFAKDGKYDMKPTNMNHLIKKTASMFGRAKKEIKVRLKCESELWTTTVDQGQLKQVLLNLYVNAWQAMPNGGEISIGTVNVELDDKAAKNLGLNKGRYAKISVTDTGIGMEEAVQRRIFEPFFTTKERTRGTGLGLASAYGIINNHRGAIKVISRKGYGTTFVIYLPASDAQVAANPTCISQIRTGVETILVVDDEPNILEVTEEMLQAMGYHVLTAPNGREAVSIFEKNGHTVDLTILDMIMPGLSGGETFDRIKKIRPEARVLLSSGYSIKGEAQKIMDRGCDGFIQKPYNLEKLSGKLQQILGRMETETAVNTKPRLNVVG
jgi:PAS domain S-box-containing protein